MYNGEIITPEGYKLNNQGGVEKQNRRRRRFRLNSAQLDDKPKSYYTTKQTHKRRNGSGKVKIVRKNKYLEAGIA